MFIWYSSHKLIDTCKEHFGVSQIKSSNEAIMIYLHLSFQGRKMTDISTSEDFIEVLEQAVKQKEKGTGKTHTGNASFKTGIGLCDTFSNFTYFNAENVRAPT